ncbi:MAG: Mini-ribonuclease 3, partial [Clostridia bacterium]|nr:Mini-ribonuclease 3 [Clostridia bacterium]
IMENFDIKSISNKNALVLAYLGDSVFSLMVRKYLVETCGEKVRGLNKRANTVVCAKAQAEFMTKLMIGLDEVEKSVVMRARNSHINNKAKNSTYGEYSLATQFEALVGFWYLTKQEDKLNAMFDRLIKEKLC